MASLLLVIPTLRPQSGLNVPARPAGQRRGRCYALLALTSSPRFGYDGSTVRQLFDGSCLTEAVWRVSADGGMRCLVVRVAGDFVLLLSIVARRARRAATCSHRRAWRASVWAWRCTRASAPCAHSHVGVFFELDCGKRLQMWWRPTRAKYSARFGALAWLRAARTASRKPARVESGTLVCAAELRRCSGEGVSVVVSQWRVQL